MNLNNWKIKVLKKMPYRDVGHYDDHKKTFGCAETGNDNYNFLIILHEFIELYLIHKFGLTSKDIDDYDLKSKRPYNHKGYYRAHRFAIKVEKLVASYLNIDQHDYRKIVNKTYNTIQVEKERAVLNQGCV